MKILLNLSAIVVFALLFSCNRSAKNEISQQDAQLSELKNLTPPKEPTNKEPKQIPIGIGQTGTMDSANASPAATVVLVNDWDKKIIKTANLKIAVKDFKKYNSSVHALVKQFGGYIAQEELN